MNAPCTGYYSVIQYCPDHSRLEAANVGVLLFVPSLGFLETRFAAGNDRIRRFFGDEANDWDRINATKRMLERRFETEAPALCDQAAVEKFLRLFANEFVFSELRAVRVEHPQAELAQLFEELVGGRVRRDPPVEPLVLDRVRERLDRPDLTLKLRRKVSVRVPVIGDALEADYAFCNGRLNLIQLKEFMQTRPADLFRDACRTAAEGHLLFRNRDDQDGDRQLIVVAAFRDEAQDQCGRVQELLREHDVMFYPGEAVEELVQIISASAH